MNQVTDSVLTRRGGLRMPSGNTGANMQAKVQILWLTR